MAATLLLPTRVDSGRVLPHRPVFHDCCETCAVSSAMMQGMHCSTAEDECDLLQRMTFACFVLDAV